MPLFKHHFASNTKGLTGSRWARGEGVHTGDEGVSLSLMTPGPWVLLEGWRAREVHCTLGPPWLSAALLSLDSPNHDVAQQPAVVPSKSSARLIYWPPLAPAGFGLAMFEETGRGGG
jgi:hypothetical protein